MPLLAGYPVPSLFQGVLVMVSRSLLARFASSISLTGISLASLSLARVIVSLA
jgi:hypothetical protein